MTHRIVLGLGMALTALLGLSAVPAHAYGSRATAILAPADTTPPVNGMLSWGDNATQYRGQVGRRISFSCLPDGSLGTVWGADVYTDDSSICTAAVHAGVISRASGGSVTIEMRPGQGTYVATTRNGVTTRSYGSWYGSYAFVGGLLTNPTIGWGTNAVIYRDRVGQRFSFTCPAGGDLGTVWGTDIYTDDSSICTAAAHVGIITRATGGPVTIEMRAGQTSYAASARNGITTRSYGSWSGSYVIVGAPPPPTGGAPGVVPTGPHQVLTGTISASDAMRDDGSWYDGWTLQLSNGERAVITMESADFDTYLTVVSPSGAMTNDDDGGDGTNSRLELTADRAGSWTIMANTYRSGETGGYTLTVDRR